MPDRTGRPMPRPAVPAAQPERPWAGGRHRYKNSTWERVKIAAIILVMIGGLIWCAYQILTGLPVDPRVLPQPGDTGAGPETAAAAPNPSMRPTMGRG